MYKAPIPEEIVESLNEFCEAITEGEFEKAAKGQPRLHKHALIVWRGLADLTGSVLTTTEEIRTANLIALLPYLEGNDQKALIAEIMERLEVLL